MARVVVTRPLPGDAVEELRADGHEVVVREADLPPSPDELQALAADADALLCLLTERVDVEILEAASRLRVVSVLAVGTDNVDLEACAARGVAVGCTPDVLTDATADLTWALLLAAARRLPEALAHARDGSWRTWDPRALLGLELRGATLGIVGAGRIGRAVAQRAHGFGMDVVTHRPTPLPELLERSDVVSLHVPLSDATRGLIGRDELRAMRRSAILVNTARGAVVDQPALVAALHAGEIAGAALDVTDPEPPAPDDPLLTAPNLVLAPHIGSATVRAREAMAARAVANVRAGLAGDPLPWPAA